MGGCSPLSLRAGSAALAGASAVQHGLHEGVACLRTASWAWACRSLRQPGGDEADAVLALYVQGQRCGTTTMPMMRWECEGQQQEQRPETDQQQHASSSNDGARTAETGNRQAARSAKPRLPCVITHCHPRFQSQRHKDRGCCPRRPLLWLHQERWPPTRQGWHCVMTLFSSASPVPSRRCPPPAASAAWRPSRRCTPPAPRRRTRSWPAAPPPAHVCMWRGATAACCGALASAAGALQGAMPGPRAPFRQRATSPAGPARCLGRAPCRCLRACPCTRRARGRSNVAPASLRWDAFAQSKVRSRVEALVSGRRVLAAEAAGAARPHRVPGGVRCCGAGRAPPGGMNVRAQRIL